MRRRSETAATSSTVTSEWLCHARCAARFLALVGLTVLGISLHEPANPVAGSNSPIAAHDEQALGLQQSINREIAAGQQQVFAITAGANQFLSVEIEVWGIDLSGTLSDPAGRTPTEFTATSNDLTVVSLITTVAGPSRVSLRANGSSPTVSRYAIRIRQLRPTRAADSDWLKLEQLNAEIATLSKQQRRETYLQAVDKYRDAIQHARQLSDAEAEARALRGLGRTLESLSRNDEALQHYLKAAGLANRTSDERLQADVANSLAYCHSSNGRFREALNTAERALRLSRLARNQSLESDALFVLGEAWYGLGNLRRALENYNQALTIKRTLRDYRGQAQALVNLGYTYSSLSDTAKARDAILEARALSVQSQTAYWEARSLRALGILYTRMGEYQSALNSFLDALEIFKVIDDRLTQATVLAGIGFTFENLGEEKKALDYDDEAIAVFREIGNVWGEAELQMDSGRVHFSLRQHSQALERYQRALVLFRSLGITRMEAQTLRDMGRVYEASNDPKQALSFYTQSLALSRKGQDQRAVAYTLDYIGHIHERAGNRTGALKYYGQALELNRRAGDPAGEAFTLFHIARVKRDLGDLGKALSEIEASVRLAESLRTNVASRDVRASFVASTHRYYELHADILMQLHRQQPSQDFARRSFEATEKARARSFVESLREAHQDFRQDVDPVLLERERALEKVMEAKLAQRAELTRKPGQDATTLTKEIDRLTAEYDSIRAQIKLKSPRYAALMEPQPFTLDQIQQRILDADSILLEYMLGDERSYLWAVTRTEIWSYELPPRAEIEVAARKFRELLMSNQPVAGETFQQRQSRMREADAQLPQIAATLADVLIGPVQTRLQRKRLLIVPDGALHYIPFQALMVPPASQPGDRLPLLVDHEIVYQPSASTLALVLEDRTRRQAPNTIAVFANPVFEADDPRVTSPTLANPSTHSLSVEEVFRDIGVSDGRVPALPASREEAEAIMSFAPWGTGLKALGFEANRAAVLKPELAQYRIVHFATHGFVDYEDPELSGLVFSLVERNGQPQEGFLRLHAIYKLKLSANLVVLSACNTGLGKEIKGEGLIGLTRGFMYAGAGGVAASLWKVDDDATAALMTRFYEGMFRKGLTPSAAMREAQIWMWQQQRWQAPYFWAAFIIQGRYDQTEIAAAGNPRAQWLVTSAGLFSVCLLAACFVFGRRRSRTL